MYPSMLEHIYQNEVEERMDIFIEGIKAGTSSSSIDPVDAAKKRSHLEETQYVVEYTRTVQNLADNHDSYDEDDMESMYSPYSDEDGVTAYLTMEEVVVPGGYTIEQALEMIKDVFLAMNSKMFGAVLVNRNTNRRMNPLHPLMAVRIADEIGKGEMIGEKYDIIFYNHMGIGDNARYRTGFASDIQELIVAAASSIDRIEKATNIERTGNIIAWDQTVTDSNGDRIGGDRNIYSILPSHVAKVNGIIYPWYATVLFRRDGRGHVGAKNLGWVWSANISEPHVSDWVSICTGDMSQSSDEGLRSLAHSNFDSPMNSRCWGDDSYVYAQSCIHTSLELYYGDYQQEHIDEQKRKTEQEAAEAAAQQQPQETGEESNERNTESSQEGTDTGSNGTDTRNGSGDEPGVRDTTDDTAVDSGVPSEEWDEWTL